MDGTQAPHPIERDALITTYRRVRDATEALAAPLSEADQQLQSMPAASPTKWHRGHTTWFFETFLLAPNGVAPFDARYALLFNSYYESVGPRYERPKRGMLSRPSATEVAGWRRAVDGRVIELLSEASDPKLTQLASLVQLGLAHEEQHQELILTDILHAFAQNPLEPVYRSVPDKHSSTAAARAAHAATWHAFDGGLVEIGASGNAASFSFDNERPRHRVFLEPYELASRAVTVGEMIAFIEARGYETPSLWLSEGMDRVRAERWCAPLYARVEGGAYVVETLGGVREAGRDEPVSHLSFYEADALASFLGARLPTEAEWEHAALHVGVNALSEANFVEDGFLRPLPARSGSMAQLFGDVWEWTRSSYEPYPGFAPEAGSLGEYNGKFMVGQTVLRGASCLTPRAHIRASYRNFWAPDTRFQMTGLRLARNAR